MGCLYCKQETFPDKAILAKAVKRKGKEGLWHKRIDKRYVKCTGKRIQSKVEICLENAEVLKDTFSDVIVIATVKDIPIEKGLWLASSGMDVDILNKIMHKAMSYRRDEPQKPSSPLVLPKRMVQ